ncbi:eukaryotic translation initiation factor 4E [Heterostelium album PN500]|uniref:Eukaryotic translation initiation factor 4E n=1 Tax=Heterostelium pallidum (strain ATCC 26659 / Pp 5 / PN500) TaxID=670386 RepID=D3B2T3_HETP5|nr:eukaryotic translation initiation factor 4E [Heterostelium album PN500]EFA83631.1 eukaryotic translation initiation factor 4E [Heterostelium album PN500]|eukprot:XP_020435748.1 eukaryotic translation initiation factor 4E [Heterostelium album PN500]
MTTSNNQVECLVEQSANLSISDNNNETSNNTINNNDNNNKMSENQQQQEETTTTTTATTEQQQENEVTEDQQHSNIKHPLQNKWSLWFDYRNQKISQDSWAEGLKKIISFDTVEDFWCVFNNLPLVSTVRPGSSFHLFKDDIEPTWEHEANKRGGKWSVPVVKATVDNQWLQAVMACVGETFDSSEDICGLVYNARKQGDKITVWTRNGHDERASKEIGRSLKSALELLPTQTIGYTLHSDSLKTNRSHGNRNLYEIIFYIKMMYHNSIRYILLTLLFINVISSKSNYGTMMVMRSNILKNTRSNLMVNLESGSLINTRSKLFHLTDEELNELGNIADQINGLAQPESLSKEITYHYLVFNTGSGKKITWNDGDEENHYVLTLLEKFFESYNDR